jgi:hypothetical protein
MLSASSKQKEVASRFTTFFSSLGIEASVRVDKKSVFVDVFDKRDERCLFMYSMRLLDDFRSVRFESFQVITPRIRVVFNGDQIELFVINPQLGKDLLSLMWKVKLPLSFQVNRILLRSLVLEPVRFFVFVRLSEKKYVDPLYLKFLETWVDEYIFTYRDDLDEKINATLDGLKSEALNSTVL